MNVTVEFDGVSEDLKKQIRTLIATRAGSVPADRDFGISWKCLDEIPEVAESLFYQELLRKTEQYIPQIRIRSVTFGSDADGNMEAVVSCERSEANE